LSKWATVGPVNWRIRARQQFESGESSQIELASDRQPHPRLIRAQGKFQIGVDDSIDGAPIKSAPGQSILC